VTPSRTFRALLVLAYAAGLGAFLYLAVTGASYYLAPLPERPRHPMYWTLKPGGSLGLRLGVAGLAMMTVMHVYSARKRIRFLRRLGPLRSWLDFHILLGILGPLFVVLHSSLKVGGLVAVSFWSMVAVALSGVFGRYLYLQIPRTRAGEELSLADAQRADAELSQRLRGEFGVDEAFLRGLERTMAPPPSGSALADARALVLGAWGARRRAGALVRSLTGVPPHLRRALLALTREKARLRRRIVLWEATHRLFHHWHVVHKPFAIVMYVFVVVHVAVALYTGYGRPW
jgi:hypothetical protein